MKKSSGGTTNIVGLDFNPAQIKEYYYTIMSIFVSSLIKLNG
jgi:hypothetical protein